MRKINESEFMFALDYQLKKATQSAESMYLRTLLGEKNGYASFVGELYTDGNNIYLKDEHDHKSWLHVCEIDWSNYEN